MTSIPLRAAEETAQMMGDPMGDLCARLIAFHARWMALDEDPNSRVALGRVISDLTWMVVPPPNPPLTEPEESTLPADDASGVSIPESTPSSAGGNFILDILKKETRPNAGISS